MSFIKSFLGRKTVDGVMAVFNTALTDLQQAKDNAEQDIEQHAQAVEVAARKHATALEESARASRLIERLGDLMR